MTPEAFQPIVVDSESLAALLTEAKKMLGSPLTSTPAFQSLCDRIQTEIKLRQSNRLGMAGDGAAVLTLPEMEVSFAHGLIVQARVWMDTRNPPAGPVKILNLGRSAGGGEVAFSIEGGRLKLTWKTQSGLERSWNWALKWTSTQWYHLTIVLRSDRIVAYCNGEDIGARMLSSSGELPEETARDKNSIGPTSIPLADVRLWNRADPAHEANVLARSMRTLAGDESGLVGAWSLESGSAKDESPFGHDGTWNQVPKASASAFKLAPAQDGYAWNMNQPSTPVFIGANDPRAGGTIQFWMYLNSLSGRTPLVEVKGKSRPALHMTPFVALFVESSGQLSLDVPGTTQPIQTEKTAATLAIKKWNAIAMRHNPDGSLSIYVNGKLSHTSAHGGVSELRRISMRAFDGYLAELRLWSTPIDAATILDTTHRRIHGWAPGLLYYFRANEEPYQPRSGVVTPLNVCARNDATVTDGKLTTVNGDPVQLMVTAAARPALTLAKAPSARPPRVLSLQQRIGLPALAQVGPTGLSMQLWMKLDDEAAGLEARLHGATTLLSINFRLSGIGISYGDSAPSASSPASASLSIPSVLLARSWSQITVTLSPNGLLSLFRDGSPIAREQFVQPSKLSVNQKTSLLSGSGSGAMTELRLWTRALSENEVTRNWNRRITGGIGLAAAWTLLDGTLAGNPGAAMTTIAGSAAMWVDAPSLTLPKGTPATRAMVDVSTSMMADQTGQGGAPTLLMKLMALGADGKPIPGATLSVATDKPLDAKVGSATIKLDAGTAQSLTCDGQGVVRVRITPTGLSLPVVRVRHAAMAEGEWTLATPDAAMHRLLVMTTANEFQKGRQAGRAGLVKSDADKVAQFVKTALGGSLVPSYAEETTAALAFGNAGEAVVGRALESPSGDARGNTFTVGSEVGVVRRIGAALPLPRTHAVEQAVGDGAVGEADALSFGIIADAASWLKATVKQVTKTVVGLAQEVNQVLVNQLHLDLSVIINGIKVVANWIIETVDEAAQAVSEFFSKIGVAFSKVADFLSELFDWSDYLETARFIEDAINSSIKETQTATQIMLGWVEKELVSLESTLLTALGGSPVVASSSEAEAQGGSDSGDSSELPGPIEFLITLLPDRIEEELNKLLSCFEPLKAVSAKASARIQQMGAGAISEVSWTDVQKLIGDDPSNLVSNAKTVCLEIARMFVKLICGAAQVGIGLAKDLISALLQVVLNLLNMQLNWGGLTDFISKYVLGGQPVTMGKLLSLALSIPMTLAYKLATGKTDGPFSAQGALSFAAAAPTSATQVSKPTYTVFSQDVLEIISRCFGISATLFNTIINTVSALQAEKKVKDLNPVKVISVLLGLIGLSLDIASKRQDHRSSEPPWASGSGLSRAALVVDYVATSLSIVQLAWDGYDVYDGWQSTGTSTSTSDKKSIADYVSVGLGVAGNACSLISLILQGIADRGTQTGAEIAVLVLDSVNLVAVIVSDLCAEGTGPYFAAACGIAGGVGVVCQTAALTTFWITSA